MPVNAGAEYFVAERRYLEAKSKEEKIKALEEMIRALPKHKGSEHLLSQLKHRLKRLKEQKVTKATAKPKFSVKKEGAAQVCVTGFTNSGKSSLLNALTNVEAEVAEYPFTTKEPVVGMMDFGDVKIQLVEIPSTFDSDFTSILQSCDLVLVLIDATADVDEQIEEMKRIFEDRKLGKKKMLFVFNKCDVAECDELKISAKERTGLEELKKSIWSKLDLIRVYTKSPRKPKVIPPITLRKGSTVKDVAKSIHKDFLREFSFARVFNSTSYSGQKVGLEFRLRDLDVVEIHTK
jgi:hypothetical protein